MENIGKVVSEESKSDEKSKLTNDSSTLPIWIESSQSGTFIASSKISMADTNFD
jgi:hypothetical protein